MGGQIVRGVIVSLCVLSAAGDSGAEETRREPYRLEEVTVTAEEVGTEGPFLPDVEGTRIFSGKKTAVIPLAARPAVINNNYRHALEKTPGLLLSEETTPLVSLGYRGLDPHRAQFTQVLKDGIPIHAEMFGYPEAYYVPSLQSVDRLEFIHGGAALMYGPQPGGALNFVTKDPATGTPFAAYSENAFGTDQLFSTYSSITGTTGPAGYLAYVQERQADGFRQANSDFEVLGGGMKVTAEDGAGHWTLTYDEYHEEHGEPGGLTKTTADSDNRSATTRLNDRFRLERYAGTLAYERPLGEQSALKVRTFGGRYRRYSKRQSGGGFGTLAAGATNTVEEQQFYTFGVEPRVRCTYDAFGQTGHTLTAGALAFFSDSPRTDKTGTGPSADDGRITTRSDRSMQYLSVFAEHLFRFGRLGITPGLRLEHIWQHLDEEENTAKVAVPLGEADEFDFVPLFGLGTMYDLTPAVKLYTNLSQSYRPKIFTQAVPTGALQVINGDLEEGKGWMMDLGARGRHDLGVSWDASYFLMFFDDQIGTVGTEILNVGNARHQGLELAVDADLIRLADAVRGTAHGQRLGRVGPYLALTLLDAKFLHGPQDGKTPQYAPQYTLRFGAQYVLRDRVKVSLGSTFVDDHFADDANTTTRTVPSYKVWDLTGEVAVWKDLVTLVGGINNLFDERYYARIRGDGIDPAPERNLYGGVRVGVRF